MATRHQEKIVFFTKYTEAGASSRYRSFQYFPYYQKAGYSITVKPLIPGRYLNTFYKTGRKPFLLLILPYLRRFFQVLFLSRTGILYIEYELFPYLPFFLEKWLLSNKKKIIIDYDDAIFHNYDRNKNPFVRSMLSNKIYKLVTLADVVITGSPYLTEKLKPHSKRVIEIATSIDFEKYRKIDVTQTNHQAAPFRLGWIGSITTSYNLKIVTAALKAVQTKYPLTLVLIGFDKQQEELLHGVHYEFHDWNEKTEIELLAGLDAGIMPLEQNDFNQGKCGFKLVQYMAAGLPTIATPLAANTKINHDNENLFANDSQQWEEALIKLITNQQYFRDQVGRKNQQLVQKYYAVEANLPVYLSLFASLSKYQS